MMSSNAHTYGAPYSGRGETGTDTAGASAPSGPDGDQDGVADASPAAARLLEMTARETDRWRTEAKGEASAIVAGAREEAAKLVRDARAEAERLVTSARDEAEKTANDARVEAYRVREETTAIRKRHDEDVARLQKVETEHRERMRHHLTEMLDRVNANAGDAQGHD